MRHLMGEPRAGAGRRAARRASPQVRRWRRHGSIALAIAAIGLTATFTAPWWQAKIATETAALGQAIGRASVDLGLGVREVYVSGRGETDRASLLAALAVDIGEPLLFVDLAARRAAIADLPWVADVAVERRLPDTLIVRLTERRPLALWQTQGQVAVIDRDGDVIVGADPHRFSDLPLVVGEDAAMRAAEFLAVVASEPAYAAKVEAAIRVGGRRWDVRFANGITVELPAVGFAAAWANLADIDRTRGLLERDVRTIDLRLPGRLFLRLTPAGKETMDAARVAGAGEST